MLHHSAIETFRTLVFLSYVAGPAALYLVGLLFARLFAFDAAAEARALDDAAAVVAVKTARSLFQRAEQCDRAASAWRSRGMTPIYAPHLAVALRRRAVIVLATAVGS